ncbi:uncharacterized protein LOC109823497 [Asparagus officinalis]|uniref:uncharacterized protein LOC109823497 n=1 Tax=Asparagus officinalis TaxID=4686 RepID=UPI00098E4802|nr:uncharacterized protein LOC109823497 [Asparagus officinalis]
METYVKKVWANSANPDVFLLKPGIFLFKFNNKDEMSDILEKGPWFFGSRPLSLKPWSIGEDYEKINSCLYPVWIQLPALKLNLWNAQSISKIASAVGRPITTDKLTANKQRLAYARVLIEVDMPAPLPDFITLKGPDDELKPRWCNHCKLVGHDTLFCKRNTGVQRWVPKTSTVQNTQKTSVQDPRLKENIPNIQTSSSTALPNKSVHILNSVLQRPDGNASTIDLSVQKTQDTKMQERFEKQMTVKELSPKNSLRDEQEVQISRIENIPQFSGLRGVHSLVHGAHAQQTVSEGAFHSPYSNNSWTLVQGNKQRKKFTPENQFSQLELFDLDPSTVDRGGAFN